MSLMNNEVNSIDKSNDETQIDIAEQVTELCEDIEVVSPGAMLCEARKALSFSPEHIASKLNFTLKLVKNIE